MGNVNILYLKHSQNIQTHVQNITRALESPTTDETYQALTKELDVSFKILATVKKYAQTLFTQIAAKALEEELVSLAGRLTTGWMKYQVNQIIKEAADLETSLDSGHVTARDILKLSFHLEAFRKDHLPSLEDRRELAKAALIIYRAKEVLEDKSDPIAAEMKIFQRAPVTIEDLSFSLEQAQEVLDIAFSIYRGDLKDARRKFLLLGENCKRLFTIHANVLGIESLDSSFVSIQALVATYNALLQINEGYANLSQVEELFGGLAQILAEERQGAGDKIFSFKSKRSLLGE